MQLCLLSGSSPLTEHKTQAFIHLNFCWLLNMNVSAQNLVNNKKKKGANPHPFNPYPHWGGRGLNTASRQGT